MLTRAFALAALLAAAAVPAAEQPGDAEGGWSGEETTHSVEITERHTRLSPARLIVG